MQKEQRQTSARDRKAKNEEEPDQPPLSSGIAFTKSHSKGEGKGSWTGLAEGSKVSWRMKSVKKGAGNKREPAMLPATARAQK